MGKNEGGVRELKGSGKTSQPSQAATERKKYLAEMKPLLSKKVKMPTDTGTINVKFTSKGNKHLYNDMLKRTQELNKTDLKTIDVALQNSTFVKSATLSKARKDMISKFYYFKDQQKELYYNVAEKVNKGIVSRFLYAVTRKLKKDK